MDVNPNVSVSVSKSDRKLKLTRQEFRYIVNSAGKELHKIVRNVDVFEPIRTLHQLLPRPTLEKRVVRPPLDLRASPSLSC